MRILLRNTTMLFCLFLMCVMTGAAGAETLNIVTVNLPPYGYMNGIRPEGCVYELGNAIAEKAGYEPNNAIVPLARAVHDVGTGHADMIIMLPNDAISKVADNLVTLLAMETVVMVRADTVLRDLRDLRGKRTASVRGAQYDNRLTKSKGMVLIPTENYSQSLKMLVSHRVDAVVGPLMGLKYTIRQDKLPRQAFGTPLGLSSAQAAVFLSRKATHVDSGRLVKAVRRLEEDGTLKAIMGKYSL